MVDLTGKRFGRLVVIQRMDNAKNRKLRWLCKCDCGKEKIILGYHLKSGHTKSCGCLRKEVTIKRLSIINKGNEYSLKHGRSKNDKTYTSWRHMKDRCTNSNHKYWKDYGGRGITVCDRWLGENGFIHFLEDMEEAPSGLTIERKQNDLGYFKENCEWATPEQQARNRRNNHYETYNGKTRLLVEWSAEIGIPYKTLYARIYIYKWSIQKALTTPVRRKKNGS